MADDELIHYGVLRRSGRYPWGSGAGSETSEGRSRGFLSYVDELKSKGLSDPEIARALDLTDGKGRPSVSVLRAARAIANNEVAKADISLALRLQAKGMSNVAIGQRMGKPESSIRAMLEPARRARLEVLDSTANLLEDRIKDGGFLDIGVGTENHLGISGTKLSNAVAVLREKGYEVHNIQVAQAGTSNKTTVKVLAPPGTKYVDIVTHPEKIKTVAAYSDDGGLTYKDPTIKHTNIDSKRLQVVYGNEGGKDSDGVIYLRPGVNDISLGSKKYAQVRIAVDGTHYIKGMAMYKNDLPAGVDLQFHTNKLDTGNKLDALKKQESEENPFKAATHQREYVDDKGEKKLSPINIVNEEGDWKTWSKTLSSQFLSKQSLGLARQQLEQTQKSKADELDEILHLTNPVVKKKLLEEFADGVESDSVHLAAAALPRQATKVILPFPNMKENEVYAPTFRDGEKVVLVRHPHGGTFEIPELTVNNKNREARASLDQAQDAIGIHPKVAERLSGADFDGDSVLVIPNNRRQVRTTSALEGLKNFDPKDDYAPHDGMRTIDGGIYNASTRSVEYGDKKPNGRTKQTQMGDISNLITDMTIKGANTDELARAVRHSMVVIDAEKHSLDYKRSAIDNGIPSLKLKYQGRTNAGASTIISKGGNASVIVPEQKLRKASQGGPIDRETGNLVYVKTGRTYVDKKGRTVDVPSKSKPLLETHDAHTLSSGMPIEEVYANHSNALKALANQARKESLKTGTVKIAPTAKQTYAPEVAHLNAQLNLALRNKPLERQAQLIAAVSSKARIDSNPGLDQSDIKKIRNQELTKARIRVGAEKQTVDISDREWDAIQSGAISTDKLSKILDHANPDRVRELATPRAATVMTPSKLSRAKAMLASGYLQSEIADALGVPVSTLNSALIR